MKDNHVFPMATDRLMADIFLFGIQADQWISEVHHGVD
jgi:hypothetical protein